MKLDTQPKIKTNRVHRPRSWNIPYRQYRNLLKKNHESRVLLDAPFHLGSQTTSGYMEECWEWDINAKSPAAVLSPCRQAVYFHIDPVRESEGTAGVRGTKGFTHGEHYWEVEFLEPPYGTSVMVGLGTKRAQLHVGDYQFINLLGVDDESWGLSYRGLVWHNGRSRKYTEPFYEKRTVIGVRLDLHAGTLSFYRNRINLGVAFTGLDKVGVPLYPLVSSTAAETELLLGMRSWGFTSLQERCLCTVLQHLEEGAPVDTLPLPQAIRGQLQAYKTVFQMHREKKCRRHPPGHRVDI